MPVEGGLDPILERARTWPCPNALLEDEEDEEGGLGRAAPPPPPPPLLLLRDATELDSSRSDGSCCWPVQGACPSAVPMLPPPLLLLLLLLSSSSSSSSSSKYS